MLVAVCASATARADDTSSLDWNGPAECPSRDEVRQHVRARVSEDVPSARHWAAAARVVRERAGYRLDLDLRLDGAEPARRAISAATCASLADATVVLIVLALQQGELAENTEPAAPAAVSGESPSAQPAGTAAAAPSSPTETTPDIAAPRTAAPSELEPARDADWPIADTAPMRVGLALSAALRLDVGTVPAAPGIGVEPRIALRVGRLHVGLGATVWLPRETAVAQHASATVAGRGALGDVVIGWTFGSRPWRLTPEAVAELGMLSIEISNVATPGERDFRWFAAGVGVRGAFEFWSGFELFGNVAGLLPGTRPRALLPTRRGDVTSFEMAAVLLRVSAGLAYVFE